VRRRFGQKPARHAFLAGAIAISAAGGGSGAPAQTAANDALHGFFQSRDQSLKIEGNLGEVQIIAGVAIYGDNIRLVQAVLGDAILKCRFLTVYYERDEVAGDLKAANAAPVGARYIRKLEAAGEVLITHQDQTVSGDRGVLDMRANVGTMTGNVVVTRGRDTMRGARLELNAATGVSRMGSR